MFVAPAGPPPVKISICPKVWNDPIKAMIVTKNRTGEMRGMVILNNFDQYPAPSISALSYNSWETFCMPPNNMMKLIPRCIQTVVIATENSAHFDWVSHDTLLIPRNSSMLFKAPNDG